MSTEKYDAYGEALSEAPGGRTEAKSASALLSRTGQVVFWLLVITIVAARIIYSPASPAFDVDGAHETPRTAVR